VSGSPELTLELRSLDMREDRTVSCLENKTIYPRFLIPVPSYDFEQLLEASIHVHLLMAME
jgi:hypothetical protein